MLNMAKWKFWMMKRGAQAQNDNRGDISLFDVKALYDAAYDEKLAIQGRFEEKNRLLEAAKALDLAYRTQEGLKKQTKQGQKREKLYKKAA